MNAIIIVWTTTTTELGAESKTKSQEYSLMVGISLNGGDKLIKRTISRPDTNSSGI